MTPSPSSGAVVHVDPVEEAGEEFNRIKQHSHDGPIRAFALTESF
jgi:hypothetical protein